MLTTSAERAGDTGHAGGVASCRARNAATRVRDKKIVTGQASAWSAKGTTSRVLVERQHFGRRDLEFSGKLGGEAETLSAHYSQIARQDSHIDFEELGQLANYLATKGLLPGQDFGDS
jgi:hypothetical protein